jgi:hypothetical protein
VKCFQRGDILYIIVGYDTGHIAIFKSKANDEWKLSQLIKQKASILTIVVHNNGEYLAINNNDALITIFKLEISEGK